MSNELTTQFDSSALEQVLIGGDLAKLTPTQRVQYYQKVCESIGLNPLTKPFDYINLNGKLTLYAKKDAADQLRKINDVSIDDIDLSETSGQFIVKVKGHNKIGRTDVEIGIVNKTDMQGNSANAQMKAVTKAKRRLTLSLCGLGWLDETEVETIPDARPVAVKDNGEVVTGEIVESEPGRMAEQQKQPVKQDVARPMNPETLAQKIQSNVALFEKNPNEKYKDTWRTSVVSNLEREIKAYSDEHEMILDKTAFREAITSYLVGEASSKDMTQPQITSLMGWLRVTKDESGLWSVHPDTVKEIGLLIEMLKPE